VIPCKLARKTTECAKCVRKKKKEGKREEKKAIEISCVAGRNPRQIMRLFFPAES